MRASHPVEHPARLLDFLLASRPDVTRTRVRQWLKHGAVLVNGQAVTGANHRVHTGDTVSIQKKGEGTSDRSLPLGLRIVFEDASIVVIDKPVHLLSVASQKEREKTAFVILTDYVRRGTPRRAGRIWIVHRLDRDTSGLMVFAKTRAEKWTLQASWDSVDKRYLAVVEGRPPTERGVLRSHLDERNPHKVRSAPPGERTRAAVTAYRTMAHSATCTLLELSPETGRRNQLRVQLADANCPIVGDQKYGATTDPAQRLGLHATSLQFTHPTTGERLSFESPLPPALSQLL